MQTTTKEQSKKAAGRKPSRCLTCGRGAFFDGDNTHGYTCRNCGRWHSATTSKAALLAILRKHASKPEDSTLDVVRAMDAEITALRSLLLAVSNTVNTYGPAHQRAAINAAIAKAGA